MKNILLLCSLLFGYLYTNGQIIKSEYRYFSFSVGATHGISNFQELGATSKVLLIDQISNQLTNTDGYQLNYTIGLNSGIFFNYDFLNDNMGIISGLQYTLYPYKTIYSSVFNESEIKEQNLISTISIPITFKYGKKFYKKMRYAYFGVQLNYHLAGRVKYNFNNEKNKYKLSRQMIKNFSPSFYLGFNKRFYNVKIDYSPWNILEDSPLIIENLTNIGGHSKHFISIQTNLHIPFNSWLGRQFPPIPIIDWKE